MRKLILLCALLVVGYTVSAQFPTTDSLRNYNTRYTTNSAINWFTNLRGQTLLRGMIDWIDSARLGISGSVGVDTVFTINDSTLRYRKNGSYYNVLIRGNSSGGSGTTDLDTSRSATQVLITSSTGTDAYLFLVDKGSNKAGLMSPTDKGRLDSLYTGTITDSLAVSSAGSTGTAIYYISGDTLKLKRLQAGTNITLTSNADSSITIAASGGGGSPGGSNTQVQFNNSSAFGGDAGLTYNSTTNTLTTDSIVMNNISLQRMLRNLGGGVANDSIGFGFCVIRGDATGGASSLISWSFIDDADHTKTYFTQVQGKSSGNTIHVSFPDAGKLLSFVAVPDETLAGRGVFIGSSVADTAADIYVYQHILSSGYLQGNGTSYDKNGHISGWTVNYNSGTGTISVLPPANLYYSTTQDPAHISAHYAGSNNYRLRRVLSGLGSDIAGWRVVDITSNTDVTGSPTSSDIIEITGLPFYRQVNAYQVGGNLYEADIFTVSANIWIMFTYKK